MTPTRDSHRDSHPERDRAVAGLRAWAAGSYPLEAAVELLARALDGRFAAPGRPWIGTTSNATSSISSTVSTAADIGGGVPARVWLDADALAVDGAGGPYSGGERRLLAVAASLAGGGPVDLNATIPGLDRHLLDLVLAAVAHAGGSHEHPLLRPHPGLDGALFPVPGKRAGTLHPWPGPDPVHQPGPDPDHPDHQDRQDRQDRSDPQDGDHDPEDHGPQDRGPDGGPDGIDGPDGGPVR